MTSTAFNTDTYYESKAKLCIKALIEKIKFARKFIEDHTEKLKVNVYTNKILEFDEHEAAKQLLYSVRDDIMNSMRDDRYAINEYVLDGLVDNIHLKSELDEYQQERELYYKAHNFATNVLHAGNHHLRFTIDTLRMKEPCSICGKKHGKKCALKLQCGHEFGRECFNSWCNSCMSRGVHVTCPICRKINV
jgi:hypothetical protein